MARRSPEQLTLREMFIETERLLAELDDHLEHGFLSKLRELRKLVKNPESDGETVRDVTVRQNADALLKSEHFTNELYLLLTKYFTAIDHSLAEITKGVPDRILPD